ncbi:unnamed protein product, partial [Oppiella nova]
MYAIPTIAFNILNHLESNKKTIKLPELKAIFIAGATVPLELAYRELQMIPTCNDSLIMYGNTGAGELLSRAHNQMIGYWMDDIKELE